MSYELEYNSLYGVYMAIFEDEVILTGTSDYQEAKEYADSL